MSEQAPITILFVDGPDTDNGALASALREAGFTVRQVSTEAQALQLLRERPHLVVLDAGLPDPGVLELCRRIKADPATATVPVLHLGTARDDASPRPPDADGYLLKPVDPHELLAHVRTLLRLRRAETALRASEARLRYILDHAPVVVHVKDLDGRYLLVNRHWERLFHLTRQRVVGKSIYAIHPQETAEALLANDRQVLQVGAPLEFEEVLPQDDGPHTYLSVKFALADSSGRPHAICGISTDITARKRAEEALRDSEALYHSLVEGLPVCLLHKDAHGRFTFANRAFCAVLGRPPAEVLGKTDFDFYPAELAHKYVQDDRRVLETGEAVEALEEHRDPGGGQTFVQVFKAPLHDARGQVVGVQGIYWDVTAAKRAEAELGRTAAEFRVARRIQQKLFPGAVPQVPGLDIAVASFGFDIGGASYPAEAIGGDYYDFVPLRDGSLGIAIGDVSGHGVGPALLMAEVRAFLRAFAQTEADVAAILGLVNRVLLPDVEEDRFITMLLARLDPVTRRVGYASAGHQPGYLLDASGAVKHVLAATSIPLGLFAETTFPAGPAIALEDGDLLLLVTDGVVEARDPELASFGVPRMLDVVQAYRQAPAREIVENLYHAVRAFAQDLPQFDDITATVIKVAGPRPGHATP